jgi:hypothetical protein
LNWVGARVGLKETQRVFSKAARAKGYLLIWTVGSGSNGSGEFRFGRSDQHGEGPDGPIWTAKMDGPIWIGRSDLNDGIGSVGSRSEGRIEGVRNLISRVDLGSGG